MNEWVNEKYYVPVVAFSVLLLQSDTLTEI